MGPRRGVGGLTARGPAGALPEAEGKAAAVRAMFDRIAPSYDRMNRLITLGRDRRWRRALVEALAVDERDTVLDLACGTGDFALLARERGARAVGVDFAAAMLAAARARCPADVALARGDAMRLPLAGGAFSVAVSGFALRNFTAIPPVLAELARVLRAGGRLGLLEVDEPRALPVRMGHALWFRRVVPALGALLSDGPAYRYLPASTAYLPPWEELRAMLAEAGFERVRKRTHLGGAAQSVTAVRA